MLPGVVLSKNGHHWPRAGKIREEGEGVGEKKKDMSKNHASSEKLIVSLLFVENPEHGRSEEGDKKVAPVRMEWGGLFLTSILLLGTEPGEINYSNSLRVK